MAKYLTWRNGNFPCHFDLEMPVIGFSVSNSYLHADIFVNLFNLHVSSYS